MTDNFPASVDVDYTDGGEGEDPADYPSLQHKNREGDRGHASRVRAVRQPGRDVWTGGKDSTLTLYFINHQVAEKFGYEKPTAVFIDHFQHFDDITDFVEHWADEWDIDLVYARNEDVGAYVEEHGLEPGDDIPVSALNEQNQHHIRDILEYEEDTFPFLLDTYVGNHLLKTVALNNAPRRVRHRRRHLRCPLGRTGGACRRDVLLAASRSPDLFPPRPYSTHPAVRRGRRVGGVLELRPPRHGRGVPG